MTSDRMTSEERLDTAMRCGVPDRVPVAPLIHYFAAACAGMTCADLWWSRKKYHQAMRACYDLAGPWDAAYLLDAASPEAYTWLVPMKMKVPGRELPADSPAQFLEMEIMKRSDYEWLVKRYKGGDRLAFLSLLTKLVRRANHPRLQGARGILRLIRDGALQAHYYRQNTRIWRRLGVAMYYGGGLEAPFDTFSCTRSFEPFIDDLMEVPELVAEAAMAAVPSFVLAARASRRVTGVKRFMVLCHRSSNDFISPRMFRDLALPSLTKICGRLARHGILTALHMDGNWDRNLELLKELPPASCTVQLDGASDIFRARKVLGNHVSILGDVPPLMLYQAEPATVEAYCKRLIEEVGRDGAFTLGAGCEVPFNAKVENVRAMVGAVKKYGYY
ncbi:MAG TPA: uroporphyrinogen decarboxylase family protein [bacterium]|nr:uroporphyrinogen decarboxylase family protein [bacterium]